MPYPLDHMQNRCGGWVRARAMAAPLSEEDSWKHCQLDPEASLCPALLLPRATLQVSSQAAPQEPRSEELRAADVGVQGGASPGSCSPFREGHP